ncbi:MAG: hypothetical protein OXB99_15690 [Acidimicrobiaceae bacterium]|nr:hypothetical protein [Acidimicrobiaceae bacterium]
MTPVRFRQERLPRSTGPEAVLRGRTSRSERGSSSSLELMALTPMLALGVLFILWAGRSARAELVTSLAAQEAAVAAALCCNGQPQNADADGEPDPSTRDEPRRELMAEAVIGARPGLDYLCLGDPGPAPGRAGLVTETATEVTAAQSAAGVAQRVLIVTTHVTCHTDGATAPVRGLFGTRTLHGHGAHVAVLTYPPEPVDETPGDESENP